ncbi:hypothetical protein NZ698_18545 [Chryseobacterium sp. PBS4-4]|uniref:DUF4468 domain-containing protein n=1 Tax=Chryseobacterium edaphi TaxID=2976532 RepID=A0ABT2WAD9_9FLAO|nr:hypothetical protein [Chryseobacterium edaphi]MCU7619183.1 hypothetical protein [Chryseobacterium edaphi]
MKKLFTICLMMAVPVLANAQTKEETISWLKEKLASCLSLSNYYTDLKIISINECEIIVKYNNPQKDGSPSYHTVTIPTEGIIISKKIESELSTIKHFWHWNSTTYYYKEAEVINVRECETDIYTRLQKAINHLNTFCPKKKETF